MNNLCGRHLERLEAALDLRGITRDLPPGSVVTFDPMTDAAARIETHAVHFSGRASVKMLNEEHCPICFVNDAIRRRGQNPGLTCDGWIENAADETLERQLDDRPTTPQPRALV